MITQRVADEHRRSRLANISGYYKVLRRLFVCFLIGIIAFVGVWALLTSPWFLRWRYRHMPLSQMIQQFPKHRVDPIFLYYLGLKLNQRGDYVHADPILRHAVGLDPDNPNYRDEWARALLGSGLVTAAFGELRQYVGTHPHSAQAHYLMGKFYVSQRAMDKASEELQKALQLDPTLGEAWAYLAVAREALGDNTQALQAAQKAVALNPGSAANRATLALLLSDANQQTAARKQFMQAIRLAPQQETIRQAFATWLLQHARSSQDINEALVQAQQALKLSPRDAAAWLAEGRAYFLLGDYRQAVAPLMRAYQLYPYDPTAPLTLREVYQKLDQPKEVARWQRLYLLCQKGADRYQRLYDALRVHPQSSLLHREMAELLAQRGDVEGCLRNWAEALHLPADAPQVLIAAANSLTDAHFAQEALPLAQRAVQIATANPSAHEALGNAWLGLNRLRSAQIEYDATVKWHPQRINPIRKRIQAYWAYRIKHPLPSDILFGKARALLAKPDLTYSDVQKAEALAQQAFVLDPENSACAEFLLELQIRNGQLSQALQTAQQLVFLLPYDHRAHALLASLLARQGSSLSDLHEAQKQLALSGTDPSLSAIRAYARGMIALKQGDLKTAFRQLSLSAQLAPNAADTFRQLAIVARALGNLQAAKMAEKRVQELTFAVSSK
ncbi:Tfp pilus assembly protein PilF [Chthonomonas calidirosea]|nr:Tfp pilus assembly protein PilF [Chthonomonas calidirosea]